MYVLCVSMCDRTVKEKRLELSITSNLVHTMARSRRALTRGQKVKGRGQRVVNSAAGVGMHVDTTA